MGKIRFVLIGFIFLFLGYSYVQAANNYASDDFVHELMMLQAWAEQEELLIEEWQLRMRQGQGRIDDEAAFRQHVHTVSNSLEGWTKSDVSTSNSEWSMVATLPDHSGEGEERLSIFAYEQNGTYEIIHTYEWKGTSAQFVPVEDMNARVHKRQQQFQMENSPVYTQLVTHKTNEKQDEKHSLIEEARKMLSNLDADEIESLIEETFVSVSAYTTLWTDAIVTNGEKMNLQLAIRNPETMGSGTTVTIGTPIITTEY